MNVGEETEIEGKAFTYVYLSEYDEKGNEIHSKNEFGFESFIEYNENSMPVHKKTLFLDNISEEKWFTYDDKGHKVYEKDNYNYEKWYEYDYYGKLVHEKDNSGHEAFYKNEYNEKGILKSVKRFSSEKSLQ